MGRRKWEVKFPMTETKVFIDLETDDLKFYNSKSLSEEVSNKGGTKMEISVPSDLEDLGILEVRKARLSPIIALGMNREIWPKEGATSLRIIMDNRNICMINDEGNFRVDKYRDLINCCSWKRWVLAIYTYEDGSVRSILWWKKF